MHYDDCTRMNNINDGTNKNISPTVVNRAHEFIEVTDSTQVEMATSFLAVTVLLQQLHHTSGNFQCITMESPLSATGESESTSQSCTNPNYSTLVSCGFRSNTSLDPYVAGSYISSDGNTCYASTGDDQHPAIPHTGVYAYARSSHTYTYIFIYKCSFDVGIFFYGIIRNLIYIHDYTDAATLDM